MTKTAPASTPLGEHKHIPLASLTPSPFNRKRFDAKKMEELTENVRLHGVLVPIIARPLGAGFEIVAGERRYRAATAAGRTEVPAIVRELTVAQAIEIQVIENNQREDVHPLEEAEGYEALMTEGKLSAEEIAIKVGKSRATIFSRLKPLSLCEDARKAFYEEKLDASRAYLIARIPSAQLQLKAMKEILEDNEFGRGPMSYRDAADHLKWNYTLQLKTAPFKTGDADLLPAAGACTTCPKRSGNQPELFGDIESPDVCTDPDCFADKRDAGLEQARAAAESKGKDVVAHGARGYVRLDDRVKGDSQGRTYRELLGKKAPDAKVMPDVQDNKTKLVEVVLKSEAQPIVTKKLEAQRAPGGGGKSRDWERERRERELYQDLVFKHALAAMPGGKPGRREFELALDDLWNYGDLEPLERIADALLQDGKKGDPEKRLRAALPKVDEAGLVRLLVATALSAVCEGNDDKLAKAYKLDTKALQATAKAAVDAEYEKDKPAAEKKSKKDRAGTTLEEVAP